MDQYVKRYGHVIPLFLSLSTIALGWLAIIVLENNTKTALILMICAFITDCLDGTSARLLRKSTQLGRQLDSLADALLYLFLPAYYYYTVLLLTDPVSVAVQILFLCAGLFRLARFNTIGYVTGNGIRGYPGLPVVFSHGIVILSATVPELLPVRWVIINSLITVHSILMIQTFPFPRPKTHYILVMLVLSIIWIIWKA